MHARAHAHTHNLWACSLLKDSFHKTENDQTADTSQFWQQLCMLYPGVSIQAAICDSTAAITT
jgi:hypothetical protein